jgi:membrane protein implicated in regulation of membrane protease activity
MEWWHWLVLGLVLVALEMAAAGGFYVIFFGVAALLVAGLAFAGVAVSLWLELLLFSVFSVISLLLFREPIMRRLYKETPQRDSDTLIGEVGTAAEDLDAGKIGRVEVRGAVWTARNTSAAAMRRGERCVVVGRSELTLFVRPEEVA